MCLYVIHVWVIFVVWLEQTVTCIGYFWRKFYLYRLFWKSNYVFLIVFFICSVDMFIIMIWVVMTIWMVGMWVKNWLNVYNWFYLWNILSWGWEFIILWIAFQYRTSILPLYCSLSNTACVNCVCSFQYIKIILLSFKYIFIVLTNS